MTVDDISGRPSRLQFPALLALMPAAGATPTPAQAREMMDKMANIYEGMRIGTAEMRGLSADTPGGPFKLAAVRFNLEKRQGRRIRGRRTRRTLAEGPRQGRTLRTQIPRYRWSAANGGAILEPGTAAVTRQGAGADSADRGRRTQGPHGAVQGHWQAGQHRQLQPGLGPVRWSDPEQDTVDDENVGPARCEGSRTEGAGCGRPGQGGGRPRSRRGLDGKLRRIRAGAGGTRNRRPREGIGAGFARQRAQGGILGRPRQSDRRGGATRSRRYRTHR